MSVALAVGVARRAVGLLQLLAEMPSTPDMVAVDAQKHIAAIEQQLPPPYHSQPWDDSEHARADTIFLELSGAQAIAELLDLFAAMPSTPPVVATDARDQAAAIWNLLAG